jgi:hypothetical protein
MFGSGDGIPLLSPVNTRMFGVHLLGVHGKEWRKRYLRDPIFLLELGLILAAFVHLIRNELYNRKSNLPSRPAITPAFGWMAAIDAEIARSIGESIGCD